MDLQEVTTMAIIDVISTFKSLQFVVPSGKLMDSTSPTSKQNIVIWGQHPRLDCEWYRIYFEASLLLFFVWSIYATVEREEGMTAKSMIFSLWAPPDSGRTGIRLAR